MRVWGAIDLMGGAAVQLVRGRADAEKVRVTDVEGLLDRWSAAFDGVHMIDLDAAFATGHNSALIGRLVLRTAAPLQIGGGLRTERAVESVLATGASRAIVGTRAIDEPAWLERLSLRWPGRLVLAADERDGCVLRRGWTEAAPLSVEELIVAVADLPLAAVLVTDVSREGGLGGANAERFGMLARTCPHPLVAAGGIASLADLHALQAAGVAEAVVGMAAYSGAIEPESIARERGNSREQT